MSKFAEGVTEHCLSISDNKTFDCLETGKW